MKHYYSEGGTVFKSAGEDVWVLYKQKPPRLSQIVRFQDMERYQIRHVSLKYLKLQGYVV